MGTAPDTIATMLGGALLSLEDFSELYGSYFLVYLGEEEDMKAPSRAWSQTVRTDRQVGEQLQEMYGQLLVYPVKKSSRTAADVPITVGRAEESDIVIEDESVSIVHAAIHIADNELTVQDAQSANGTFVDDQPIDSHGKVLSTGMVVRFGSIALKVFDAKALHDVVRQLNPAE